MEYLRIFLERCNWVHSAFQKKRKHCFTLFFWTNRAFTHLDPRQCYANISLHVWLKIPLFYELCSFTFIEQEKNYLDWVTESLHISVFISLRKSYSRQIQFSKSKVVSLSISSARCLSITPGFWRFVFLSSGCINSERILFARVLHSTDAICSHSIGLSGIWFALQVEADADGDFRDGWGFGCL